MSKGNNSSGNTKLSEQEKIVKLAEEYVSKRKCNRTRQLMESTALDTQPEEKKQTKENARSS